MNLQTGILMEDEQRRAGDLCPPVAMNDLSEHVSLGSRSIGHNFERIPRDLLQSLPNSSTTEIVIRMLLGLGHIGLGYRYIYIFLYISEIPEIQFLEKYCIFAKSGQDDRQRKANNYSKTRSLWGFFVTFQNMFLVFG